MLSVQSGDQVKNCVCGSLIEIACRLVCQQQLRTSDERASQSYSLLLASGKFACPVVASG